jgi:PhoPQ-activated pathogenicity-related protein
MVDNCRSRGSGLVALVNHYCSGRGKVQQRPVIYQRGSHNTRQPQKPKDMLLQIALATQSVVVGLHNIPNQPTVFVNDDYGPRGEDELIAYGWRRFLEGVQKQKTQLGWLDFR